MRAGNAGCLAKHSHDGAMGRIVLRGRSTQARTLSRWLTQRPLLTVGFPMPALDQRHPSGFVNTPCLETLRRCQARRASHAEWWPPRRTVWPAPATLAHCTIYGAAETPASRCLRFAVGVEILTTIAGCSRQRCGAWASNCFRHDKWISAKGRRISTEPSQLRHHRALSRHRHLAEQGLAFRTAHQLREFLFVHRGQ